MKRQNFRSKKEKSEFEQKVIDIRRVARVVAGGRRFSFRVTVVVGDKKGKIGVGMGKGADTAVAIEKAVREAKKNIIKLPLTKNSSIPHEVEARFGRAYVVLRPAKEGRGLVVGSAARTVLNLAGIKDVVAKVVSRSKNKLNIAKATIFALKKLKSK